MANHLFDRLFAPHAGQETPFLHRADGTTLSHAAFLAIAGRYAAALRGVGVSPGDRVAVQVAKSPEALALYAASVAVGAVFLPLNTAYTDAELGYFLDDSEAALVVLDPARADAMAGRAARLLTLDATGGGSLPAQAAGLAGALAPVPRGEEDLAALLYTSGTTGRSKGAMLSHANLASNAETLATLWRFGAGDVLIHALPIFHTHGLFVASNVTLVAGGSMVFLPRFDVDAVIAALPRATALMGVPTFYTRLLEDPRLDRGLTAHMRLFVSGSAPLLAETHRHFEARTGHRILERYGMTETNMTTSNPYQGARRPGTVGRPLPGVEVVITDPATGDPLPAGAVGQITVRGPNVFQGYWRMPEKTAAELRADGFFLTGDLGQIDAEGYLTIVGRSKDLIIAGGYNIYPKEIELVLDAVPGVAESAVVGAPDPDLGEAVVAYLVPEAGVALDLATVHAAAEAALARFKRPRRLLEIAALPRNAMGKVEKAVLREMAREICAG